MGSKTEIAILEYIEKTGNNYQQIRKANKFLQKMPFNSARKRMSVIIELPNGSRRLYVKGASEIIVGGLSGFHSFSS
jgi:magnesium-transporting ATPase (P-type)